MIGQKIKDKELVSLLGEELNYSKDENGYLIGIEFNVNKLLNKVNSNKVDIIISYIQGKLSFLEKYEYEIEEIIYNYHLSIPDTIYVSFLKPVNDIDWGEVLYAKK